MSQQEEGSETQEGVGLRPPLLQCLTAGYIEYLSTPLAVAGYQNKRMLELSNLEREFGVSPLVTFKSVKPQPQPEPR